MHIKQERRCIACRERKQQYCMLRIARINYQYVIDENLKLGGRGAYICKNKNCLELTIKKRLLNRIFKTNIDEELYKKIGMYEKVD